MPSDDFRSTLLEIDGDMGMVDIERLKFLTKDHIPHGGLAKSARGIDVFSTLEQRGKLKEGDSRFLQECFHYMQRRDLVRKLGGNPDSLEQSIQREGPGHVLPFRVLLYDIAEDIGAKDLETLKFYVRNKYDLTKKQIDSIETCLDLFTVLEREGILHPPEVRELENLLKAVDDQELMELVQKYKNDHGLVCQASEPTDVPPPNPANHVGHMTVRNANLNTPPGGVLTNQGRQLTQQAQGRDVNSPMRLQTLQSVQEPDASDTIMSMMNASREEGGGACAAMETIIDDRFSTFIDEYKMTANPRGYCIIINNQHFTNESISNPDEHLKERKGTEKDAEKLKRVFGDKLKFIVKDYNDLSAQRIKEVCQDIAGRDHARFDALVVCILSHGTLGKIHGVDGRTVDIQDVKSPFTSQQCPTLVTKPKMIFLQVCQGTVKQRGYQHFTVVQPSSIEEDGAPLSPTYIPDEQDFLIGYATVPGYASFRSRSAGSFYISKLVEMLDKYAFSEHLLDILIRVNREVCSIDAPVDGGIYKQVPAPSYTLTKLVRFREL